MSRITKTIAVINQKGGVGKTTTTVNLGIGLAAKGKKVLLIDCDPQGSLTIHLGLQQPEKLPVTLSHLMGKIIKDEPLTEKEGFLTHSEGVEFIPANRDLTAMEATLIGTMSGETILRRYLEQIKEHYDYILIDCLPSLGALAVNAITAADSLLIPVQPQFLDIKGLGELLRTYEKVRRLLNPALTIEGVLLTMVNHRTVITKNIIQTLQSSYAQHMKFFDTHIPSAVSAKEASSQGASLFAYDPQSKAARAYASFVEEVLGVA